jgi:dTMP kinase
LEEPPKGVHGKAADKGEEPAAQVTLEISGFRKVLKNRDFMALWIGQAISSTGDWVIVGVLLDSLNRLSPSYGLVSMMTARFLPAFLFGLVAGAVVDRLQRKTLMITCELVRCGLVLVLAFANNLVAICALVFGIECFSLLFGPARDSCIPDLVSQDEVMTANSMISTSTYLTMAMGTLIATVILGIASLIHKFPLISYISPSEATFQHQFAFIVDALTFMVSAMLLFTIAFPRRKRVAGRNLSARSIFTDLREGLRFMRTDPLTRGILGIMIIGLIGGGSLYILGAPFAQQALKSTGAKFTLLLSSLMIGVVIGAAGTPWFSERFAASRCFVKAVIGFGAVMVILAMIDFYPLSLVVILLGGTLLGYLLVTSYTLLHQHLDEEVRGRVFAAMNTVVRTCLLLSMGIFAFLNLLFLKWIPWTAEKPVSKVLNIGFFHKSFYPAMLAMMVGGTVVIIGGIFFTGSLHKFFRERDGGEDVTEAGTSA